MSSSKKMLLAFILNFSFSVFEFFGGIFTGSTAIMSDALHDTGDAVSIGLSLMLEKKSMKAPDEKYTFGYRRYSVMGGLITTVILSVGSILVIVNGIRRIINPVPVDYNGMIAFAVVGTAVNLGGAYLTHGSESVNQKAVNLHMLEDVLGWIVVLIGAVVMKFTDFALIDPLMSIAVALFIIYNSIGNLKEILDLFNMKTPEGISVEKIMRELTSTEGIEDVHHIHIWSIDGSSHYSSMHIVTDRNTDEVKKLVRKKMNELGISHTTIETERSDEHCHDKHCHTSSYHPHSHGHHHH